MPGELHAKNVLVQIQVRPYLGIQTVGQVKKNVEFIMSVLSISELLWDV
jgi:hypothetical protein